MAGSGICYTQSGNLKKYEPEQLGSIPMYVTAYTVGYPSTAYYPDAFNVRPNFYCYAYPGPPGYPQRPGFTEGTAEYLYNVSFNGTDTYNKIYNLMSYTPPYGYVLDENGDYIVTTIATVYSCNLDVKYGGITNSINGGRGTIEREFKYKKKDKPSQTTDIRYPVTLSINGSMVHCSCQRVTWIPGTNNGNFVLGVNIEFRGYNSIDFKWEMKNGIDETKDIGIPNPFYSRSEFTTRSSWQVTNSDGNITNFIFDLQLR